MNTLIDTHATLDTGGGFCRDCGTLGWHTTLGWSLGPSYTPYRRYSGSSSIYLVICALVAPRRLAPADKQARSRWLVVLP